MRRLTVYLKFVEQKNGKIKNTISYKVKDDRHMYECLALHEGNVKKHQLSYFK